jgi:hypothetical protein
VAYIYKRISDVIDSYPEQWCDIISGDNKGSVFTLLLPFPRLDKGNNPYNIELSVHTTRSAAQDGCIYSTLLMMSHHSSSS